MKTPLQIKKRNMAFAGLVMSVYLIFHMFTTVSFFNQEAFSGFYQWYNDSLLHCAVLIAMIAAIAIHVKAAVTIRRVNAKARRVDYQRHDKVKIPAIFVTLSIILLLSFIVIHIVQTLLFAENTYQEVIELFQSPITVLFYLAGLFVLLMHLQHSLANVLQTLGKTSKTCHVLVWLGCLTLIGGFASVPLYISVVMP